MTVPTTTDNVLPIARRASWDVDEVAVERACHGDRTIPLNRHELAAAFRHLDQHGQSIEQIAAILGVTARTVTRWRTGQTTPVSRRTTCPDCSQALTGWLSRHRRRHHADIERLAA